MGNAGQIHQQGRADPEVLLTEWQDKVVKQKLFACSVVYGYFKCHNRNNLLQVEIPNGAGEVSFDFPRSTLEKHLCITDYFGENDIVVFQIATVGKKSSALLLMNGTSKIDTLTLTICTV